MSFWHEGARVSHPKLHAAFLRGVRFLEEEGVFVVQLGHFRGQIDVEDNAWWVVSYDAASGCIELTDRSREPLDVASLIAGADASLSCTVKTRFPARFTHAAQSILLNELDLDGAEPRLRVGCDWVALPPALLRDWG